MKRKLFFVFLIVALFVVSLLTFVGCGEGDDNASGGGDGNISSGGGQIGDDSPSTGGGGGQS